MNIEPIEIDLDDWYQFGGGFTADSLFHKTDDSLMLKLYAEFMRPLEGYNELNTSEKVLNLGVLTAKPVSYVKCGKRYGAIFERVPGKRSFARILADEPDRMDELAQKFAEVSRQLHSTKCDTEVFPSMAKQRSKIISESPFITDSQKEKALKIIENTPASLNCVHGDFHVGNVIIGDNGIPMFIDLPDFAYGNELFDLGTMMMMARYIPDEMCVRLYHVHLSVLGEFWEKFLGFYFPERSVSESEDIIRPYAGLQAMFFAYKNGFIDDELKSIILRTIGE